VNAPACDVSWSLTWEDDVTPDEHAELAALFSRCFPHSLTPFAGARSWSSGRPEVRLVGRDGADVVAHLGILRRFLQAGGRAGRSSPADATAPVGVARPVAEHAVLVGDVGLVATDPAVQGRGTGAELMRRTAATLRELEMPFGFLTCGEQVAGFYARAGWVRVDNPTRMVRADGRVQVYGGVSMVLPVCAPIGAWPAGVRVDRNGVEV
jgi:nodulation protein A